MQHLSFFAAAAALGLLTACTATEGAAPGLAANQTGKNCFWLSEVSGFNDAPDADGGGDRIYVSVGANERYLFETFGACPDLNWSQSVGFDQDRPGQICSGLDIDLIVPSSIGPQRCPLRMISKVPEESGAS